MVRRLARSRSDCGNTTNSLLLGSRARHDLLRSEDRSTNDRLLESKTWHMDW